MKNLSLEEKNKIKIEVLKTLENVVDVIDKAGYLVDPQTLIEIEISSLEASTQEFDYKTTQAMLTLLMMMKFQEIFHILQTSTTLECEEVLIKSFHYADKIIMNVGNEYATEHESKTHLEGFVQTFFDSIEEQKINFIQLESITNSIIADAENNIEELPGYIDDYLEATFRRIKTVTKPLDHKSEKYVDDIEDLNQEVKNIILNIFATVEQNAEFEVSIEDINKLLAKPQNKLLDGEEWNQALCSSIMHVLYKLNTGISEVSGQQLEEQWAKVEQYKNELAKEYFAQFSTRDWVVPKHVTKLYLYDLVEDACSTFIINLLLKKWDAYAQKSSLSIKPKITMTAELYFHPITIMN